MTSSSTVACRFLSTEKTPVQLCQLTVRVRVRVRVSVRVRVRVRVSVRARRRCKARVKRGTIFARLEIHRELTHSLVAPVRVSASVRVSGLGCQG